MGDEYQPLDVAQVFKTAKRVLQTLTINTSDVKNERLESNGTPGRDKLPIQNQRAVLLTHDLTRARHIHQQNRGLALGNAIVDATDKTTKKTLQAAAIAVANADAADKKRIQTAAKKQAKKEAEDQRVSALTPEERQKERQAVIDEKTSMKRKREEAMDEKRKLVLQHTVAEVPV